MRPSIACRAIAEKARDVSTDRYPGQGGGSRVRVVNPRDRRIESELVQCRTVDCERMARHRAPHAKSAQRGAAQRSRSRAPRHSHRFAHHFGIDPVRHPSRETKSARGNGVRRQQRMVEAAQLRMPTTRTALAAPGARVCRACRVERVSGTSAPQRLRTTIASAVAARRADHAAADAIEVDRRAARPGPAKLGGDRQRKCKRVSRRPAARDVAGIDEALARHACTSLAAGECLARPASHPIAR